MSIKNEHEREIEEIKNQVSDLKSLVSGLHKEIDQLATMKAKINFINNSEFKKWKSHIMWKTAAVILSTFFISLILVAIFS